MPARRTRVEERPEAFGDCTTCGIGGTVHACQEPGLSSKGPRRLEIGQAASSAAQVVCARSTDRALQT